MRKKRYVSLIAVFIVSVSCYAIENPLFNPEEIPPIDAFSESLPDFIQPFTPSEADWTLEREKILNGTRIGDDLEPPFIMMAGYMDTDISWESGGQLSMLAYVTDEDSPVDRVEMYWQSEPTGVLLYDDGNHADYGAGDGLWGFTVSIPPETVPAGEYLLELKALDSTGNYSDLWPYLTIH